MVTSEVICLSVGVGGQMEVRLFCSIQLTTTTELSMWTRQLLQGHAWHEG